MAKLLAVVIICALSVACTCKKKDAVWEYFDVEQMGRAVEPGFQVILPKDLASGVQCTEYGEGCKSGRFAELKKLKFMMIQFENEEQACNMAKRIDQFYSHNWVFDDVAKEPILEEFVKKAYNARRPLAEDGI